MRWVAHSRHLALILALGLCALLGQQAIRAAFDQGWVKQPLLHVDPLNLSRFPEKLWLSRAGAPHPPFDPASPMDFGPGPPEP